jgi:hypothetical protein
MQVKFIISVYIYVNINKKGVVVYKNNLNLLFFISSQLKKRIFLLKNINSHLGLNLGLKLVMFICLFFSFKD